MAQGKFSNCQYGVIYYFILHCSSAQST